MDNVNGYLINSAQVIKFLKWYLENPLRKQFRWIYKGNTEFSQIYDNDKDDGRFVNRLIQRAKRNPHMLFFGNELQSLVNSHITDDNSSMTSTRINDGLTNVNGKSVAHYINYLEQQSIITPKEVTNKFKKLLNKRNAKEKAVIDKENWWPNSKNKAVNEHILEIIKMYSNDTDSNYSKYAKLSTFKPYLKKSFELYKDIKPLLEASNKYYPKHKVINTALRNAFHNKDFSDELQKYYLHYKNGFPYIARFHVYSLKMFSVKLDVFEAVAWLFSQKYLLHEFFSFPYKCPTNQYAFASDVSLKHLKNCGDNDQKYLTDPHMLADYKYIHALNNK